MRLDSSLCFSDEQSLSLLSADSTNTVNLRKAGIAESQEVFVIVRNIGAVTKLGTIEVQGSSDDSTFAMIETVKVTDLTDGGGVNIKLPQGCPQYIKLVYKSSGSTVTTDDMSGKVSAYVTLQADSVRGKRITDYAAQS